VTRTPYQQELQRLQGAVHEELDAVSRQLALVLDALEAGDQTIADRVIEGDAKVDRLYAALQNDLVTVIARQAPVASDLRLITALLYVSRMIERMGDQCVNIAKLVAVAGPRPGGTDEFQRCLLAMGKATAESLTAAATTLLEEDLDAARALEQGDTAVNELNRSCFAHAIALGDTEDRRAWATAMILVSRALERIADNAVDVGAHMRFAVTGRFEARPVAPAA
jgi:phosphate transport system protein